MLSNNSSYTLLMHNIVVPFYREQDKVDKGPWDILLMKTNQDYNRKY